MTIDKDFLSNFSSTDESDDYKRTESIQIGFEQELKSLTVSHGDSARFEAKISSCRSIVRSLLHVEWRLNDVCITQDPNNSKYQFGCISEENRYWMEIQKCQQQDEKVYTIHISYDNGRLHDESSAYLFVNQNDNQLDSLVSVNEQCLPPTIIRSLQSTYRYHPGEQLHFLVEYRSCTDQCHCMWQVQRSNDANPRSIEDGLIVNADCSSILIIESITAALQGLYTFYVENLYGRAMTQTIVIVNNNDLDVDVKKYQEIDGLHHRCLQETSADYEDVRVQNVKEEPTYSTIKGKTSCEPNPMDILSMKDLYGQRHIAYFDLACKFDHVESIEQLENEDLTGRHHCNGHRLKNGHDKKIRIPFELPPPPPIEEIFDEHIYEDIPTIPQTSTIVSVQESSNEIIGNDFNLTEQVDQNSPSPSSLVEVLNHVEQWSDIIVDQDTRVPQSPRQIAKISVLSPSANEYVDEIDGRTNGFHDESNHLEQSSMIDRENEIELILVDPGEDDIEISENGFIEDESSLVESYTDQITYNDAEDDGDDEKSVSSYLLEEVEQVVETIHVGEELFEAKETVIVGIQAPNDELSDNESTSKLTSVTSSTVEDLLLSDLIEIESHVSDEQKPEVIIVTTEEISMNSSSTIDCIIESERATSNLAMDDQTPIISSMNINEKSTGDLLESLSVPVQPDLLPLATMPDQTTTTDEQRIPDRTVQDVLSASLEPTRVNHHEGLGEIMSNTSFVSTEKSKDHEEFFDVEAEKPPITLAEAEKLQHDAAVEQKDEEICNESKHDLVLTTATLHRVDHSLSCSTEINSKQDIFQEIPTDDTQNDTKKTDLTHYHTDKFDEAMNVGKFQSNGELPVVVSGNKQQIKETSLVTSPAVCEPEFVRPKFSVRLKPTITFNVGDDLKLEVHFIGQPEPKVTWYFKSNILKPSSNLQIIHSQNAQTFCSILTMSKISTNYEGKFKVTIKNNLAEAVSVAQVNIKQALISVQLHTPTKKTGVGKTSARPIANE